jgi:hypothetical protein
MQGQRRVAGAAGFEPATLGFGDRCSNQAELRSCVIANLALSAILPSAGKFYGCRNGRSIGLARPRLVRGGRKTACKPSSVRHSCAVYALSASSRIRCGATIIYLAPTLPTGSCGQPGEGASALCTPTIPASGSGRRPLLGLAPDGVCPALDVSTEAVSSYLAISPLPRPTKRPARRYVSVALSVGSPRPAVSGHPARRELGLSSPRYREATVQPSYARLDFTKARALKPTHGHLGALGLGRTGPRGPLKPDVYGLFAHNNARYVLFQYGPQLIEVRQRVGLQPGQDIGKIVVHGLLRHAL